MFDVMTEETPQVSKIDNISFGLLSWPQKTIMLVLTLKLKVNKIINKIATFGL